MPLILSGNVASATAAAGYDVANSCRFEDGSSAYMAVATSDAGTDQRRTWTFSTWFKIGNPGLESVIFCSTATPAADHLYIRLKSDGTMRFLDFVSGNQCNLVTTRKFRDVGAWYHLVIRADTTQSTASDRLRIYINGGDQETFGTEDTYDEDQVTNTGLASGEYFIGVNQVETGAFWDGYLAETYFCSGQSYAPTQFGEFNEDSPTIWQPIDASGSTFGTNGFYLDYEASDNLGNDANGGTDFTETNLAATDQATDTPTNNFCTVNPLDDFYQDAGFTEGNCKLTFKGTQSLYAYSTGTFGVSGGKWYWENKATSAGNHDNYGIVGRLADATSTLIGRNTDNYGYYNYNGKYSNAATDGTYREVDFSGGNVTWTTNDIIGIALDMENDTVSFYKNNALTGTIDIIAPSTGFYYPAWNQVDGDAEVVEVNFGNPSYSLTSAANDANGYGNFEYAPPSGYLALCTKNLGSAGG